MPSSCAGRSFCTPRLAIEFSRDRWATERAHGFEIGFDRPRDTWVGAGEPILYLTGPLSHLVRPRNRACSKRSGRPALPPYNASAMCADLPKVAFLAMDARHCAGARWPR